MKEKLFVVLLLALMAAIAAVVITSSTTAAIGAEAKAEAKPAAAAAERKPANGIIEVGMDGKVLWGSDHDTVAKALLKTIQDYDKELQKQRLLNDILLEQVAKLRGGNQ